MTSFFRPRVRTEQVKGKHTGLPGRPFISTEEAIKEGWFDYIEDAAPAQQEKPTQLTQTKTNEEVGDLKPNPSNGEVTTETTKRLESKELPTFYRVQDKTGVVKFDGKIIDGLEEMYDKLTSPHSSEGISDLEPEIRELFDINDKIKYNKYRSIDELAADIALCVNIVSKEEKDFKGTCENIFKTLGVTADNKKHLFDITLSNSRKLNNDNPNYFNKSKKTHKNSPAEPETPIRTRPTMEEQAEGSEAATPANLPTGEIDRGVGYTNPEGFNDLAGGEDFSMPDDENQKREILKSTAPDAIRHFESLLEGKSKAESPQPHATEGVATAKLGNQLGDMEFPNKTTPSNEPLSTHPDERLLSDKDVKILEAKIEEFKRIQREGALSDEQLSEFIELAKLQEKGFKGVTYGEIPTTLLSEPSYNDQVERRPAQDGLPAYIQVAADAAIARARIEAEKAAREVRRVAVGVAAVGAKNQLNLKKALGRLGVLGIEPEISREEVLKALGYVGPNKVPQISYQPRQEKQRKIVSRGWRDRLFGSGPKAINILSGLKNWWQEKTWDRKRIDSAPGYLSETTTIGTAALTLLALLIGAPQNKKVDAVAPVTTITSPASPIDQPGLHATADVLGEATKITSELRKECQAGNYKHMIGCIKAVVGTQTPEVRKGLVKIIAEAAEERAKSEGVTWSKLNKKEKDAYIDAVLGGTQDKTTNSITKKDSPASAVAKHYRLNVKDITFTGADGLSKIGIDIAKFKTPESLDQKVIVDMIVSQLKK